MDYEDEQDEYGQTFLTSLTGVTKNNDDGTSRQEIIMNSKAGQSLKLVREPDNPFDRYAIAIYNQTGQQLGYIPEGDSRLASHIDMGGEVTAKIYKIKGGPGLLGKIIKSAQKQYGCVIKISKGSFNWSEVEPYRQKSDEIEMILDKAKKKEAANADQAIKLYREAISQIIELDNLGTIAAAWRSARYPINRLSLLLEKNGELQTAYDEIVKYEKYKDDCGLLSSDAKSVEGRKIRLERKIGINY